MGPLAQRDARRAGNGLLTGTVVDDQCRIAAGIRRQEEVLAARIAKVQELLRGIDRTRPIEPTGDGHLVRCSDVGWQLHILRAAIKTQGFLARDMFRDERHASLSGKTIEQVVGSIGKVVLKLPTSQQALLSGRGCSDRSGALRLVLRTVDGLELVFVFDTFLQGIVQVGSALHLASDGVPLIGAFASAQHHVTIEVVFGVGRPREQHATNLGLCRKPCGHGRSIEFTLALKRQDAPHLEESAFVGGCLEVLLDVDAYVCRIRLHLQIECGQAVANEVATIAGILEVPLLVVGHAGIVADDVGTGSRVVEHVHVLVVHDVGNLIEAVVAGGGDRHPLEVPLLGIQPGVGHLRNVGVTARGTIDGNDAFRGIVHDFEGARNDGRWGYVGTIVDVDDALGVGLTVLIALAARNLHGIGTQRTLGVEIDVAVVGDEGVGGIGGLTLGRADKGTNGLRFIIAIDGC